MSALFEFFIYICRVFCLLKYKNNSSILIQRMKKVTILIFLALVAFMMTLSAQEKPPTYLWPIKDGKAGENILSAPQTYIAGELNFSDLFIGAPEGTTVVSPVDGIIPYTAISYYENLTHSGSYTLTGSYDETLAKLRKDFDKSKDARYLNGILAIQCNDGNKIYISGLTGDICFKTGQKIKRGEPIGKVGYSYRKIKEPSIHVSISRYGKVADPMQSFGIKSTFIPPAEIKPVTTLTKQQAKEDFSIYINSLKEVYPGLYNVLSREELKQYVDETNAYIDSFTGDMSFGQFWYMMQRTVAKIHDSHIYMHGPIWEKPQTTPAGFQPKITIGRINNTLICTNAVKEYQHLIEKPIVSVNGLSADSIKEIISSYITTYDAKVEQYKDYRLALNFGAIFRKPYGTDRYDMLVEFADGTKADIKGQNVKNGFPQYVNNMRGFHMINRNKNSFALKVLNDSIAYISLSTFSLNQVQVEEIAAFIDSISDKKNLIVDVRNNGGGDAGVLSQLYSYLAGDSMTLDGYMKVNKRGDFESFKYSLNRMSDDIVFPDYKPEDGKDGYYLRGVESECKVKPDPAINYKGRVYMLANENSLSAAASFPALLVRNHRGVVVGRETGTAYHFMNALKFSDMRLPNSLITITIPLTEICFDTVVNDRVPFGRGVLPDYYVPITYDELTFRNGDAILNYALKLIKNGEYLKNDNPFK